MTLGGRSWFSVAQANILRIRKVLSLTVFRVKPWSTKTLPAPLELQRTEVTSRLGAEAVMNDPESHAHMRKLGLGFASLRADVDLLAVFPEGGDQLVNGEAGIPHQVLGKMIGLTVEVLAQKTAVFALRLLASPLTEVVHFAGDHNDRLARRLV